MLTLLVGTQAIAVTITSAYVAYNLSKQRSKKTKFKLIHKDKSGFKHYKTY